MISICRFHTPMVCIVAVVILMVIMIVSQLPTSGVKLRGYAKKSSHLYVYEIVYAIFRTENYVRSI